MVFSGRCSESWRKGISERRRKLLEGENSKTQQSPVNILIILPDLKSAACCCPFFFSENISSLRVMKGMLPWSGHNSNLWFFIIPGCLPRDGHQEDDDGPPEELTTETAAAVEEVDELLGEVWQMP